MNTIECNNLTKQFGDLKAVNGISLSVKKGEVFGFLGTNGVGKTTAIRTFCGLSYPTSRQTHVTGFGVYTQQEQIKKYIGHMSQKFSLYGNLAIRENITFYGGVYGVPQDEVKTRSADLIAKLGLEAKASKFVGSLPLGRKRKFTSSVAIFHRPEIVFLDEPTGGVDPITRRQFRDMIYGASAQGITVFITTHYVDGAEYCHCINIMVDGKVEAMDTPTNLKNRPHIDSMDEMFYQLAHKAERSASQTMEQLMAFIRKEFYHVLRDRCILLILFGIPIAQIVLLDQILSSRAKSISIAVPDEVHNVYTQQTRTRLILSTYSKMKNPLLNYSGIETHFREGALKVILAFPPDLGKDLYMPKGTTLQPITDGADPNAAKTVENYLNTMLLSYQRTLNPTAQPSYQIMAENRMLYNEIQNGSMNFIPGMIAFVSMVVSIALISVVVVREKELGTTEISLVPFFNPLKVLIVKAVPHPVLSFINFTVTLSLSIYIFGVPAQGNLLLFYIESTLFIIICLALSLLISASTSSQ